MELRPIGSLPRVVSRDELRPYVERIVQLEADLRVASGEATLARLERIVRIATDALVDVEGMEIASTELTLRRYEQALRDIVSDARRTR